MSSLSLFACGQGNEKSVSDCKCPIGENIDAQKRTGQDSSHQTVEVESNGGIEAVVKKAVGAKISVSGSYSNSNLKIEEVYREIIGSNPQITQKANLYRSVACAYYEIACQDKLFDEREKRNRLNEIVAKYEQNIDKIIDGDNSIAEERGNQNNPISPEEGPGKAPGPPIIKQPIEIEQDKPMRLSYSSMVRDENGRGIADVEIYCPNCIVKNVKTKQDGSFELEGYFDKNAYYWQSTLTLSSHHKSIDKTINWREKSPQSIHF